jgi:RNA polymerase sigma factor (sigma-70 family)
MKLAASQLENIRPEIERLGGQLGGDLFSDVAYDLLQAKTVDWSIPQQALIRWVAKRRRIDLWRRNANDTHQHLSDREKVLAKELRPDEELSRAEEHLRVRQCLQQLQPHYREVVELVFFQGLSKRAVGKLLSLPLETVRTRTKRAIRKLRKLLSPTSRKDRNHE